MTAQNIQSRYLGRDSGRRSSYRTAQISFFLSLCYGFDFLRSSISFILLTFGDRSIRSQGLVSSLRGDSTTLHEADLVRAGQFNWDLILVQETYQPLGNLVPIAKLAPYGFTFLAFIQSRTDSLKLHSRRDYTWFSCISLCSVSLEF